MTYRLLILTLAGLFLGACGNDDAASGDATTPEAATPKIAGGTDKLGEAPDIRAFRDPAYGGDIIADESGQILSIPEEEGSEAPRVGGIRQ